MKRVVGTIVGIIAGLGLGYLIGGFCEKLLGSPIYGFVIIPLVFGIIGNRLSGGTQLKSELPLQPPEQGHK